MHRLVGGSQHIADLRGLQRSHFIATTVDLLTTGVDVPPVRNIAFFKYVRSPIAFYQMIGRGTRIDEPTGKLMFRVYDYTDATRLFGHAFVSHAAPSAGPPAGPRPGHVPERTIRVEERPRSAVSGESRYIVVSENGRAQKVTVEEYQQRLAERLSASIPSQSASPNAIMSANLLAPVLTAIPDQLRQGPDKEASGSARPG